MSRIGNIGGLGTDQIRALNRLSQIGKAISQNQQRISTLKRINSAKDDPSGLIRATLLESELKAAESASNSITRANATLSTADAAAGEIVSLLQDARTLVLEAAGGTLSDSDIAANQVQVDSILSSINSHSRTEFNGQQLLNGTSSFRAIGYDTSKIDDVDILSKNTEDSVAVSLQVTTDATQATDTYSGGALGAETTLTITGESGSASITIANGADATTIASAFNDVTYLTGITAAENAGDVDFTSTTYGTDAKITIVASAGSFTLDTGGNGGTVNGVDAIATINGSSYTADGATFNVTTSNLSMIIEVDPTVSGATDSFTITGSGLEFVIGSAGSDTARVGLPDFTTASLGGTNGKLSTIGSGQTNSLTGGGAATALAIIDDAIADVTRGQAVIGSFQKYTLDTSSNVLNAQIENVSAALSSIQDVDLAAETASLANNQLLQQTALEVLSISNMSNNDVLSLLRSVSLRF